MQMMEHGAKVDPQSFMGGMGAILSLDTHGIYEERIWMLYKDLCQEDIIKTFACLRGCQLGFISEQQLSNAINGDRDAVVVDDVLKRVKDRLDQFDRAVPALN